MILCCGEALIDMVPMATKAGRDGFVPHPGGAIYNTAIALGRLGARSGMLSGLSSDMFGRQLVEGLKASHVDVSHVVLSDRPTTLAFVQLADGHATYDFYDENSAGRMIAPDDMPTLSKEVTALYFGGISLACEPGAEAYADLLERSREGRVVMLDPNIRPGFIRDVKGYRRRLDRMLSLTDIVKVSDEDLHWLMPGPLPLRDKVARLQEKGASVVILTRGSEGATGYLSSGEEVHVPAAKAEVVDTVGAGDTFNAGVLAKLSELGQLHPAGLAALSGEGLAEALTLGARVAAVTVSRTGANPPWAEEL